jgi:hypothetical protein
MDQKTAGTSPTNDKAALVALLAEHRRLALARAPLVVRIPVLRRLLKHNTEHRGWRQDLNEYERVRLKQIEAEVKHACNVLDLKKLEACQNELQRFTIRKRNAQRLLEIVGWNFRSVQLKFAECDLEDLQRAFVEAAGRGEKNEAKRTRDRLLQLVHFMIKLLQEQLRSAGERADAAMVRKLQERLDQLTALLQRFESG